MMFLSRAFEGESKQPGSLLQVATERGSEQVRCLPFTEQTGSIPGTGYGSPTPKHRARNKPLAQMGVSPKQNGGGDKRKKGEKKTAIGVRKSEGQRRKRAK